MSTKMTTLIEDEVRNRLDRLAKSTRRSKSSLAAEAIRDYVANNAWQVAEIRKALKEADAGHFATEEEVSALARR